jgi:hypothetical protein
VFRFRSKPPKDAKTEAIRAQIRKGHTPRYGFLHIPKTGGSGITVFARELVKRGHAPPCIFGHGWKVGDIAGRFPEMKLCFILRDPLDRMISGFNSRLRQGRPTYNSPWTPAEATAFSMLPSAAHLLDAIVSDDDFHRSALDFAMRHILHLRWNYTFYFQDLAGVATHRERFAHIGQISAVPAFIDAFTALSGAPPALAAELYEKRHESGSHSRDPLAGRAPEDVARIRNFLRREYLIHGELLALAAHSPGNR